MNRFFLFSALLILASGCSVRKLAINKIGDALASGNSVFATDPDPELVREAAAFSLKLTESLIAQSPRHAGLLVTASSGFTQYAYGFLQQDADRIEDMDFLQAEAIRTRSRGLYLRGRDYGLRGLQARHPKVKDAPGQVKNLAAAATKRDVPLLYWTAVSWAAAISISKNKPALIAGLPQAEMLMDRALALDESFSDGAIHSFLISYEPSRPSGTGDPLARSRLHFEQAVKLSKEHLASPYVAMAETVSEQTQNRAEFESLLRQALAIDVDFKPEWRLENLLMQQRARWLLSKEDDLFLDPIPTEKVNP